MTFNFERYFSTIRTETLFDVFDGFMDYRKTGKLTNISTEMLLDYVNRYSKREEPYSLQEIETELFLELARRFRKSFKNFTKDSFTEQEILLSKGKAYDQVRWERDIAIEQLHDIGCELGQKMDYIIEKINQPDSKGFSTSYQKGTATGYVDTEGHPICVGDIIEDSFTGFEAEVVWNEQKNAFWLGDYGHGFGIRDIYTESKVIRPYLESSKTESIAFR